MNLSVVVTDHDSSSFLQGAINSVCNQASLSAVDDFVVVTRRSSSEIQFPRNPEIVPRIVPPESAEVGGFLSAGVRASTGKVICFLDGDDEWKPGRLSQVRSVFRRWSSLAYYQNPQDLLYDRTRCIGPAAEKPDGPYSFRSSSHFFRTPDHSLRRIISRAHGLHGTFNLSSIAVCRSSLVARTDWIAQITGATDLFVFYCALGAGGDIFLDSQPLTRYRIYQPHLPAVQRDMASEFEFRRRRYEQQIQTIETLERMLVQEGRARLASYVRFERFTPALLRTVVTHTHHRREFARILRAAGYVGPLINEGLNSSRLYALCLLGLLSPAAAAAAYRRGLASRLSLQTWTQ